MVKWNKGITVALSPGDIVTENNRTRNFENQFNDFRTSLSGNNPYNVPIPDPYSSGGIITPQARQQYLDRIYEQQIRASEWESQYALMLNDRNYAEEVYNKYNSPEAQVRQMRNAGLNPDLQNIHSGSMSPSQSQTPNSSYSLSQSYSKPALMGLFLSFLPQAVSIFTNIKGSLMSLNQQRMEIENFGANLARQDFLDKLSSEHFLDIEKGILKPEVIENAPQYFYGDFAFHSRKGRPYPHQKAYFNKMYDLVRMAPENLKSIIYSKKFDSTSARKNFLDIFSSSGLDLSDEVLVGILRDFKDVLFDTQKKHANTENLRADNDIIPDLMSRASKKIDSDRNVEVIGGYLLYILSALLQSGIKGSFSRNVDDRGNVSSGLGFGF